MLSGKLIHLIEAHEEQITGGIVSAIRQHPDLHHLGRLSDLELRERCREILENLGYWLAHGQVAKLASHYEAVGKSRYAEGIPLEECVRGMCLIRERMIDFLDAQGIEPDPLAMYAEGQLVRRLGPFFDLLTIHLVRGFETACRHARHAAA